MIYLLEYSEYGVEVDYQGRALMKLHIDRTNDFLPEIIILEL